MDGVSSPVKRFILHFPCDCEVGYWIHLGLLLRWPELTHILKIYKENYANQKKKKVGLKD
jgi:hypothetical protein